jgi:hypothetical protein
MIGRFSFFMLLVGSKVWLRKVCGGISTRGTPVFVRGETPGFVWLCLCLFVFGFVFGFVFVFLSLLLLLLLLLLLFVNGSQIPHVD